MPEGFSQLNNPSMSLLGSQSSMQPVQTNVMKTGGGGMEVCIARQNNFIFMNDKINTVF